MNHCVRSFLFLAYGVALSGILLKISRCGSRSGTNGERGEDIIRQGHPRGLMKADAATYFVCIFQKAYFNWLRGGPMHRPGLHPSAKKMEMILRFPRDQKLV